MVTEAGKELLRNTINTAKFHNRILEENEMWKQWELERGLTMMVSDDVILGKSKRHHQCSKHLKRSKSKCKERERKVREVVSSASSSKDTIDRWDHNGFRELYPDETDSTISSPRRNNEKKWDHSGFLELYPEEAHKDRSSCSKSREHSKSRPKKKKRKHHSSTSTSDNEIWEEFKTFKRNKVAKKSRSYDTHISEWKKRKRDDM